MDKKRNYRLHRNKILPKVSGVGQIGGVLSVEMLLEVTRPRVSTFEKNEINISSRQIRWLQKCSPEAGCLVTIHSTSCRTGIAV